MNDLFGGAAPQRGGKPIPPKGKAGPRNGAGGEAEYNAAQIEVLEGLEPVRRRPGMYIGGTDANALHHLFAEVIDNAMDEAVAGHATTIEVTLEESGFLSVIDNGRGMPVDPHPKFPKKSALEVIMTVLHAGGKFDSGAYETSGGLHGVGVSVVNALSESLEVEVARGQTLYRQTFARGKPTTPLTVVGKAPNRRGTKVRFLPDPQIFGPTPRFDPARVFKMARSKAYLFGGVEIRWRCAPSLLGEAAKLPGRGRFPLPRRPEGLSRGRHRGRGAGRRPGLRRPGRQDAASTARSSGRSPGSPAQTASSIPIATPSRRPTAERTKRACGRRCCAVSRITPSASARRSGPRADDGRCDGQLRRADLHLHSRARVPGSEQGPPSDRGSRRVWSRAPCATPSTIGWRPRQARRRSCSTGRSSARRSESGAVWRRTSRARPRCGSCACPASLPIARIPPRKALNSSSSRAIRRAARPSRRATAPLRPCCRFAARSSMSPPPRATSSRRISN